ncbi:MAG: TIGR03564 family F420-dependent LLM class oxidoreductase [Myxococcota bacterium]
MRLGTTVGGETLDEFVDRVKRAEADGFAFVSAPNIFGLDAVGALTIAGRETERIELATGVVPTQPRHPTALAQQALTAQAACRGRFTLGIGLSHQVVIESMFGLSYAAPAKQMEEYLQVLVPLLQGKPASHQGDLYRVNAGLQVPDGTPVPTLVAALGPRMLEVAGRLADGTATWMTGRRTLADHIVPSITRAAAAAGRPQPRIVAALPIAVTHDADAARKVANEAFQMYGTLPSYRAMLDRESAAGPGDVAIVGDEAAVRADLAELRDAGVTDFAAAPFPADEGAVARTREFLLSEL